MSSVGERLHRVASTIPAGVTLVAVSKFHPAEAIAEAYAAGQRIFAESRAQELVAKAPALPADIKWHFIGHLQTNKIRAILPHVSMIQSIDSLRLLEAVGAEAVKQGLTVDVLLEVNVSADDSKTGMSETDLDELVDRFTGRPVEGIRIRGIMGMATWTDDADVVQADFNRLHDIFTGLRSGAFASLPAFDTLSMGMSDDRDIAIACGSTMVRVGTDIFGNRQY